MRRNFLPPFAQMANAAILICVFLVAQGQMRADLLVASGTSHSVPAIRQAPRAFPPEWEGATMPSWNVTCQA